MKPKRTPESAPQPQTSAPIVAPPVNPSNSAAGPDKTQTVKLVPGVNVFCVDCLAFDAKNRRCHFWPPPTNSSFTMMRGRIDSPKEEWCMQFKLRV